MKTNLLSGGGCCGYHQGTARNERHTGGRIMEMGLCDRHCRDVADNYGYKEIHLPIFEHTELFCRGVGETTDVVEKEMYTFEDKGGRSITLRPELTASMVRSYLENEMYKGAQPAKLWSIGPMFRYERPQKGRYRQFVQLDIEALGAQDAYVDLEVIDFSMELYRRLGLSNLQVVL